MNPDLVEIVESRKEPGGYYTMDKIIKPEESIEKSQSFSKAKSLIILITVVVLVVSIVAAILYKYISGTLVLNLNMVELISLVLAIFSIGISIAFYFKASETSDRFYIHSYEYMKEQSILLGRIEERFGEKLGDIQNTVARLVSDKAAVVVGKQEEIDQGIENGKEKFMQSEEYRRLTEERDNALKDLNNVLMRLNNEIKDTLISQHLSKDYVSKDYVSKEFDELVKRIPLKYIDIDKIAIENLPLEVRNRLILNGIVYDDGVINPSYRSIFMNLKFRGR